MDDTQLYLVRIWQGKQRFRASVRRVDDETRHVFDTPEAVASYLSCQAATSKDAPSAVHDDNEFGRGPP